MPTPFIYTIRKKLGLGRSVWRIFYTLSSNFSNSFAVKRSCFGSSGPAQLPSVSASITLPHFPVTAIRILYVDVNTSPRPTSGRKPQASSISGSRSCKGPFSRDRGGSTGLVSRASQTLSTTLRSVWTMSMSNPFFIIQEINVFVCKHKFRKLIDQLNRLVEVSPCCWARGLGARFG
jgi:hypothetical protein